MGGISMNYKVGLIVDALRNVKNEEAKQDNAQKMVTANAIHQILKARYETEMIVADQNLIEKVRSAKIDIAFNLSTGTRGESRQSQIPAVLEMLGIPYLGSGVLGHSLALNKAMAKQIFSFHQIATPRFQIINTGDEPIDDTLIFPMIVKPACEGSGFGIHSNSVVHNADELSTIVQSLLKTYQPPILIEEFIKGREFTVGIIGNGENKTVLPIMEIDFKDVPESTGRFNTFEVKHFFVNETKFHCPAVLNKSLETEIADCASKAFDVIGCKDFARVDIRERDNKAYVIEINSLPGLEPGYSDLPKMAEVSGVSYETLIYKMLDTAMERIKKSQGAKLEERS
jgi:D-alanine-D-alanine ligase